MGRHRARFLYFTDHEPDLGRAIREGRHDEFAHFARFSDDSLRDSIPDPQAAATFKRSRLDWTERVRQPHARFLAHVRTMIALRSSDPVLAAPSRARTACEGQGPLLVARRWLGPEERTLMFNPGDSPERAGFSFASNDVLLSSTPLSHPGEVPPRTSVVVRTTRT